MPDIDSVDRENPLAVTEYVNDIFSYWFRVEPDTQVAPNYMLIQTDINDKMRAILIDWLVEVHLKFKLMPETLFLTHNLIDRFLAKKVVTRRTCSWWASRRCCSLPSTRRRPEVRDFVYISDKAYTREQILNMEKQMLNTLGFHLTVPTPYQFMSRFYKAAGADKQFQLLASFIVESALPDYSMLKYPASLLAASAVYVAMKTLGKGEWNDVMEAHTRYTEADIRPCADAMARLQRKSATAACRRCTRSTQPQIHGGGEASRPGRVGGELTLATRRRGRDPNARVSVSMRREGFRRGSSRGGVDRSRARGRSMRARRQSGVAGVRGENGRGELGLRVGTPRRYARGCCRGRGTRAGGDDSRRRGPPRCTIHGL